MLRSGSVLAIKGIGGYHLACLAADPAAVATLRARKHREEKPLALMAADLDAAHELVELDGGRGGAAGRSGTADRRRPPPAGGRGRRGGRAPTARTSG